MNTRDRILARLRAAPRPPLPEPDIAGFYAASPPAGLPQQLAQWARSMKSYQGQVVWCHAHDWEDALLQQLRSRQVRRLLLARQTAHGARTLAALARLETHNDEATLAELHRDDQLSDLLEKHERRQQAGDLPDAEGPPSPRQ